jgi:hypothetical protein
LKIFPVWSTTPKFSFLNPKREVLEIPQTTFPENPLEEGELLKTYINPLFPENSQLILQHLIMAGKIPHQQPPPPPPPRFFNKVAARYAPLNIPVNLHDFPDNYLKLLPRFNGEGETTTLEHLETFDYFTDNQGLEYEYVYMRIFFQTFEGEVRTWFKGFPPNSINSWDALETAFLSNGVKRKITYIS